VYCCRFKRSSKTTNISYFEAKIEVEVEDKAKNETAHGEGHWLFDKSGNRALESIRFFRAPHHDVYRLQRYDLGYDYEIFSNNRSDCIVTKVNGSLPDPFAWVANATYAGTKTWKGRQYDLWTASIGYANVSLAVHPNGPNRPVWMGRTSPQGRFDVEFIEYTPKHPLNAMFTVPSVCHKTEYPETSRVGCVARSTMMSLAEVWVEKHVPYNQGATYQGYREDCSGYVSMAWQGMKPGWTTYTLPSVAHPIDKTSLQPGDVLLCTTEHVVIFGGWADSSHYIALEETQPSTGTMKSVVPYPYWYNTGCFKPYRYNSVC